MTFKQIVEKILKTEEMFFDTETKELNYTKVKDSADRIDPKLISLLADHKETKEKFFTKIGDVYVFNINDFKFFLDENKINNSYTQYANQIGLSDGSDFLKDRDEVVLGFPYKDCVLEGGQSTEEGMDTYFEFSDKSDKYEEKTAKRSEVFFNQVLARDEIDRLFDKKALVNWKRYTKDGGKNGEAVKGIERDENGTIKENLIIKGNNLISLHSLKSEFSGEVKLIYIDPPFYFKNSKQGDSFVYNSNFKLSTWLTFLKNRLKIAHDFLKENGSIFVQIDDEGYPYLRLLLDEIFGIENYINTIHIKTLDPSGFRSTSDGLFKSTNQIFFYGKNKQKVLESIQKIYIEKSYDEMYSMYLINKNDKYSDWKWKSIKDYIAENIYKTTAKELVAKIGKIELDSKIAEFAIENASSVFRTAAISGGALAKRKTTVEKSKSNKGKIFVHPNEDVEGFFILNGEQIVFYGGRIVEIDGHKLPGELVTDLWLDIPYNGISGEGGITLTGGKKPEKLLQRIIEMVTSESDIVLDFFGGSGTSGAVAHKMNRQYILMEQMDYIHDLPESRLINVINGEQTGISKSVNWQGGGSFVYCELAKWNEQAKDEINMAKDYKALEKMFDTLYEKYFFNYNVKTKEFKEKVLKEENFKKLTLEEQKRMFLTMLDLNQMYVQESEMGDKRFGINKEYQELTKAFYRK